MATAFCVLMALGCSAPVNVGQTNAATLAPDVRVTADMYSGRPNPTWNLAPDEVAQLNTILSKCVPNATTPAPVGGLGFRQFTVEPLPPGLEYKKLSVSVGLVSGTTPGGQVVSIGNCDDLFSLLRLSAQSNLGAVASSIPKG